MQLEGGHVRTSVPSAGQVGRPSVTAVWSAALATCSAAVASVFVAVRLHWQEGASSLPLDVVGVVGVLGCLAVGVLLVLRSDAPHVGWLLVAAGGSLAVLNATFDATIAHELGAVDLGRWALPVAWVQHVLFVVPGALALVLVPMRLPDGSLPSPRWRVWERSVVVLTIGVMSLLAFVEGPLGNAYEGVLAGPGPANPWGLVPRTPAVEAVGTGAIVFLSIGAPLVSVVALVVRFVRADQIRRRQLGWIGLGMVVALTLALLEQIAGWLVPGLLPGSPLGEIVGVLAVLVLVAALGAGVLRYRLWDVDLVVNRSAVGLLVSVGIVIVYTIGVGAAGAVLGRTDGLLPGVVGAGLVAAVAHPIRTASQRIMNRLMFGDRDDPTLVLGALGRELADAPDDRDALRRLAVTVSTALRVPHVAVEVEDRCVAAVGAPRPTEPFPLRHRGATIGILRVAPRSHREELGPRDRHLLTRVADHAGLAAHAARLAAAVHEARISSTTAREDERRRLRRDLHDGLGPTLAGHSLTLERTIQLVNEGHPDAIVLLERLHDQTRSLVGDIRTLVHDLRPPALDELGLVGALRALAARFGPTPRVTVDHRGEDPRLLSAAIEVAIHRIVAEAVTNVVRHAAASTCAVTLEVADDHVVATVIDDGRGRAVDAPIGTGTVTMTERAEELGGTLHIDGRPGIGTTVTATLPLRGAA